MIVAHILGIPVEENVSQLAPIGGAMLTAVAIAGRTWLGSRRRGLRKPGHTDGSPSKSAGRSR